MRQENLHKSNYNHYFDIYNYNNEIREAYYELSKLIKTLGAFNFPYYSIDYLENKFIVTVLDYPQRANLPEHINNIKIDINLVEKQAI